MINTYTMKKDKQGYFQCVDTTLWIDEQFCSQCQWNVDCSGDNIKCAFPINNLKEIK